MSDGKAENEKRATGAPLAALAAALILVLFLITRLPLIFLRDPFFDELFTIWLTSRGFAGMLEALRDDSGPPLFYFLVRVARLVFEGIASPLVLARSIALLCGLGSLLLLMLRRSLGTTRWIAAVFLSIYLPAVYFSAEARSYALCALLVGVGSLALMTWVEGLSRRALIIAVVSFTLAACSHYYAVLLFPLPAILGVFSRKRTAALSGALASVGCGILFIPGFLLAFSQPEEAIGWMREAETRIAPGPALFLHRLGTAAPYSDGFAPAPPLFVQLVSLAMVLAVLVWRTTKSRRAWIFAAITVLPWLIGLALALAGRPLYFPMRFESIVAVPLALWWGESLQTVPKRARAVVLLALIVLGLYAVNLAVLDHASRQPDEFRRAVLVARAALPSNSVVVASGFAFLETHAQTGADWQPRLMSFPAEQAIHPGWRAEIGPVRINQEIDAVLRSAPEFFWITDSGSGELQILSRKASLTPIFRAGPVYLVRGIRKQGAGASAGTSEPGQE